MSTITCYKISPRSAVYEGKLKKRGGSQDKQERAVPERKG